MEAADAGHAGIAGLGPDGAVRLSINFHRTEFIDLERFASKADPPLGVNDRAAGIKLDRDRDQREERQNDQSETERECEVERTFAVRIAGIERAELAEPLVLTGELERDPAEKELHLFGTTQNLGSDTASVNQIAMNVVRQPGNDHLVATSRAQHRCGFGRRDGAQNRNRAVAVGSCLDRAGDHGGKRSTSDQDDRFDGRIDAGAVEPETNEG